MGRVRSAFAAAGLAIVAVAMPVHAAEESFPLLDLYGIHASHGDPLSVFGHGAPRGPTDVARPASHGDGTLPCSPEPQFGFQLIYAHPSDAASRLSSLQTSLLEDAASASLNVEHTAGLLGGARKRLSFVCGITDVPMQQPSSSYGAEDTFDLISEELLARGFSSANRKYIVWWDGPSELYCGQGSWYDDASPSGSNRNNVGPSFALIYRPIGEFCGWTTVLHEAGHTIGAVQDDAPNSTRAAHCIDGADIMCYADGGPRSSSYRENVCARTPNGDDWFDCNGDDYFHPSPPPGSYLASAWNTYSSSWLVSAGPALNDGGIDTAGAASGDAIPDPGDTYALTHAVRNDGSAPVTGISGTLSESSPLLTLDTSTSSYPDAPAGSSVRNESPYQIAIAPTTRCGTRFPLEVLLETDQGTSAFTTDLPVGSRTDAPSADVPKSIPDLGFTTSTLSVTSPSIIHDLDLELTVSHPLIADIDVELISPRGTRVTLTDNLGGGGESHMRGLILDDEAARAVANGLAPFRGRFRPKAGTQLAAFDGEDPRGTWTLRVTDEWAEDVGTIDSWSLEFANCTTVARESTGVTVRASRTSIRRGGSSELTATLSGSGGGLGARRVDIEHKPSGASAYRRLSTVHTAAGGTIRATVRPSRTTAYRIVYRGQPGQAAKTSAGVTVRVSS